MIFDVTVVLVLGHHEPRPFRIASLAHKCCVCSDCSSDSLSPRRPPYSMRHNNINIRQLIIPPGPEGSSERESHAFLTSSQKLDIIKLSEEGMLKRQDWPKSRPLAPVNQVVNAKENS